MIRIEECHPCLEILLKNFRGILVFFAVARDDGHNT